MLKKIVPQFRDKEKYVSHLKNLHFYLRLGLKLKKNTWRIRTQSITVVLNLTQKE